MKKPGCLNGKKYTLKEKKSTKFIFKQILNTVFGVFFKSDTRSHGLGKQNAIDMQIQSAERNKNTSSRRSPFFKGSILIVEPYRQKCQNSQFWTHPISNHAVSRNASKL